MDQRCARYDKENLLAFLILLPRHIEHAKDIGESFPLPASFKTKFSSIVITGLGGSAIGGDVLKSYLSPDLKVPIVVNRNYALPAFVNGDSLVVVSSYSGNTEETLSAYNDARKRRAKIIAVTSGGNLFARAKRDKVPVIRIPAGMPPRCAIGYSFFTVLTAFSRLGLIKDRSRDILETISVISGMQAMKSAGAIARSIYGKLPLIYGSQDHTDAVAIRWRGQLAENAKTLSSSHFFPELCHNEIVGFEFPARALKNVVVVLLRDKDDHARISKRFDIVKRILSKAGVPVVEVRSRGRSALARIFSLIYLGDFVSYALAIMNRVDPTPVEKISYLKKELCRR